MKLWVGLSIDPQPVTSGNKTSFIGLVRQEPFYWCQHPNSVCCRPTIFMKELTGKWELTGKTDSANMFMWCRGKEKNICKHAYNTHTHKFVFVFLYEWMMHLYSALLCIAVHPLYNHVGTFHWLFYSTALFTLANYFQFFFFLWNWCFCLYNLYKCYFVI